MEKKIFSINRVRRVPASYHEYATKDRNLVEFYKKQKIYNAEIEDFIAYLGVTVSPQKIQEAHFTICIDKIYMPYKCYFRRLSGLSREQSYYSTLFHELAHWTGHKKRLARKSLIFYNTDVRSELFDPKLCAIEEVTAELTSNMLMEFFELQKNPSLQSLGLINKELSTFDRSTQEKIYLRASRQASRAFSYIIKQYRKYEALSV